MVTKVADMTADEFAESITKAMGRTGPTPTPSGSGAGGGFNLKGFDSALTPAISGVTKLGEKSTAASTAIGLVSSAIGKYSGAVQAAFDGVTAGGKRIADNYQTQLSGGVAFSDGLMGFAKDARDAGLSTEEYAKRQAASNLGLAAGSGEAMKKITELGDSFKKSDIGIDLQKRFGLTSEQMERYTLAYIAGSNNINLQDEKAKKAAIEGLGQMTERTIRQSLETGKNTDLILKQNQVMNESLQVQMMRLAGDEDQNASISALMPQLTGLGPALTNLALEAQSSLGVTGPKAAMTQGALGNEGQEFVSAIQQLKEVTERGGSAQEKAAAEQRLAMARQDVDAKLRSKEFLDMAEVERRDPSQTATGGAMKDLVEERLANLQKQKAQETTLNRANLPSDARNVDAFGQEQTLRVLKGVDERGQTRPGDAALSAVQQGNMRLKDEYLNAEVKILGEIIPKLDKFSKVLDPIIGNRKGERVTSMDIAGRNGGPSLGEQQTANTPRVPTLYPKDKGSRDLGTDGVLGMKLEPKDTTVKIHKGEKVLNPTDAMKFESIGGLDLFKSLSSGKIPADQTKDPMAGMDPAKMFGNIQQQITPMMENMQKQMTPMMENMQKQMTSTFSTMKMPSGFDDKKLTSMIGNIKQPDPGQLANMAKSMIPPADNSAAAASRDMISNLKNVTSSIAQPPKTPELSAPAPASTEEPAVVESPAPTESFNNDILNALNNLNKLTAQSLDALVRTAGHTEKTAGGIDGLNGNRFG